MQVNRNLKIRLRPTPAQAQELEYIMEQQRQIYIAALDERRQCYEKAGKTLTFYDQTKHLTQCRKDPELPEMAALSQRIQEGTLRRLDRAYKAFFRRAKSGEAPGFPRFPGKKYWNSFEFRYSPQQRPWNRDARHLSIPRFDTVNYRDEGFPQYKDFTVTQAVIERNSRHHWYATVGIKFEKEESVDDGRTIGIDLNTGDTMIEACRDDNPDKRLTWPRPDTSRLERQINRLRRKAAKRKVGSVRWHDAQRKIAKKRFMIANITKSVQHKATTELAKQAYTVATEKLKVKNMTRSAKGTLENPGKNVKAKAGLNRVMSEASPSRTIQMISYKAGKHIEVDPKNTSRKCNACGYTAAENRKGSRFRCRECGHTAHADHNAARNVLASAVVRTVSKARGGAALVAPMNRESTHKTRDFSYAQLGKDNTQCGLGRSLSEAPIFCGPD